MRCVCTVCLILCSRGGMGGGGGRGSVNIYALCA